MAVNCLQSTSSANEISLHAELRSHVSVFNLTVGFRKCLKVCNKETSITADGNSISVTIDDKSSRFVFNELELLPATCRGLQWRQSRALQMTLQVKVKATLECEDTYGRTCQKQEDICSAIQRCQNNCFCANCGQKVLKNHSVFSRVLPLPSENWSDLAEFWFCHRHDDDDHSMPSLSPKSGDCLVGSLHVVILWSHIKRETVNVSKDDSIIQCSRCSNVLGIKHVEKDHPPKQKNGITKTDTEARLSCQLFLHAVRFASKESMASVRARGSSLEVFLSELLQEQSRLYTSFRFLVQSASSSTDKTVKMLVWLIDQDLTLYQGSENLDLLSSGVIVKGQKVIKLLYKCTIGPIIEDTAAARCDAFLYKTWEKDNTVHGLTLPRPLCLQLISTLIENTRLMPTSLQHLNGFHVSYLLKETGQADYG